ncbi:class I SAM-dependent methyltransferase [Methylobacterium nonmethylotrophicum]|uniref:Class I SAM-dependent methyltransferase n=1 Tax=Methylobacterium nonmethylotrophicum TaxID=1141884 RepID=A0A4Z0NTJ6_9HYPH|nr:class I SAM-dependent methyltransferase [Methylobacterium nonmethylotrophicum]TGE00214.1 class I SAM-dependent methyltransferase [Methylobacterium nonmethylotrophicum]
MPEPISQTEYWNGDVGARWVGMQTELDRVFAPLTAALLDGAALRPGERVLDIGCGCGETALLAAERLGPEGAVTGVDVSRPMLERARERPTKGAPITWVEADAQVHAFAPGHDLALSRFGVMFFDESRAAFANIRRGLRPGGRLAILCWRALPENDWVSVPRDAVLTVVPPPAPPVPGSPGPFRFADRDGLAALLAQTGFSKIAVTPVDRLLEIGRDAEAATRFAVTVGPIAGLLRELDDADLRDRAVAAVRAAMPSRNPVRLGSACWLATAINPG